MPVVCNTWFDQFEVLDVPRLRRQLQAAKKISCEVFIIDAGWYGLADEKTRTMQGAVLMSDGIEITLPLRRQAAVIVLTRERRFVSG